MASAVGEYMTASLLHKNTTVNMSHKDYKTALIAAAAEFEDLKKLRIRGKPVDYKSRYLSGLGELQDWVESEYDVTFKEWVLGMVPIADNHATTQQVVHVIRQRQGLELKNLMGGGAEFFNLDLTGRQHFPFCQVTPMNQVAHPDSLDTRRTLCGPYKVLDAPAPATVAATVPVTTASITDLVTALATKDDKQEQEKLKLGLVRTNGVYMGGTTDMTTGIIHLWQCLSRLQALLNIVRRKQRRKRLLVLASW